MERNGRLNELDALRGIAALSVMLFHYTTFYSSNYGHSKAPYFLNFQYGYFGVHLFFIISGFVIYMTIIKCASLKEFVYKRIVRLYPAYIVSVIITFLSVSLFGLNDMSVRLRDAFANLTMLQGIMPGTGIGLVDGSYWSLAAEIYFYAFCGSLFALGLIRRPLLISLVSLFLLFAARILYLNHLIHPVIGDHIMVNYSNLFIAGVMFYQLKNSKLHQVRIHGIILLSLIYEFCFKGLLSGFIISMLFITFYLLIYNYLSFLNKRLLTFMGSISYSMYLIHQNIGYIVIHALEKLGLIHEVFIIIPISISICLAILLTIFVEKPIQAYFRRNKTSGRTAFSKQFDSM